MTAMTTQIGTVGSAGPAVLPRALAVAAIAALLTLLAPGACAAAEAKPLSFAPVPLHGASIDGTPAGLSFDGASQSFRLSQGTRSWQLPRDFVPQAALRDASRQIYVVGRPTLRSELRIVRLATRGQTTHAVSLPEALARRLYLMHAFATGGRLLAAVYDIEETIASGRSGSVVRDGMDLYAIEIRNDQARLTRLVDKAPIAGLDNAFRDLAVADTHYLCAQSGCIRLVAKGAGQQLEATVLRPTRWSGYAQLELFSRDGQARVLLRRDEDDRFTAPASDMAGIYRDCPVEGEQDCIDLPAGSLPAGVGADGRIIIVSSCSDIENVLRRDLSRLPGMGLPFWAMNNHEGRIAWGQIYVLDGLLDLATGLALPGSRFAELRDLAHRRVALEVDQWARLAAGADPWLWSRRYSIERADLLSVLHLGRMARVTARAHALGPSASSGPLLERLHAEMVGFVRSLEELHGPALHLKRGMPFWLDGSNAPWNYQSGWIEGIVALERSGLPSGKTRQAASAMVREFIRTEIEPARPDKWNYCAGLCQQGWNAADGISTNTPNWEGNKTRTSAAHTSYRSMDARAVLEAQALWNLDDLSWFSGYARDLVQRGWLYPMVAAPLSQHGARPTLGAAVQMRHGRSALPYEVHNQIWALDALGRTFESCVR
jgi:hypothetical protein